MGVDCQDSNENLVKRISEAVALPPYTVSDAEKLRTLLKEIMVLITKRVGCRCCGKEVW
jgi:hypothetical protein